MSALSLQPTFPIFTDTNGLPLENGYIWIGEANLDPQGNPITVYWDAALTIAAAQPIRTLAGYPSRSGTPARVYVNSDYSIRVQDKNASTVYSAPQATERYGNIINADGVVYDPPFTGALTSGYTVEAKLSQTVSVKDFGAVGDGVTDDTAAIQAAFDSGAADIFVPAGNYLTGPIFLNSVRTTGVNIRGAGIGKTRLIGKNIQDNRGVLWTESPAQNTTISGFLFEDFSVIGEVATLGFSEFKSNIDLHGVRDVIIQRVESSGFRGDGLIIGASRIYGEERHNYNVTVRDCIFDGINNDNRNCISVIDVDGAVIENNIFKNTTRTGMPGAIDFEPNLNFGVIKNIQVSGNRFSNIGGDACVVCNLATAGVLTTPLLNLNICGNVFESSNTSSQTIAVITLENISTVPFMGVSIEDNVFHAENLLMTLWRINGLSIARNFSSAGITITLGKETEAALNAKNVIIDSNSFLNVSDTTGLMTIASVENLTIVNNTFKPKDANIRALLFYGNGVTTTSSNVVITGNLFLKSTSQTIAIGTSGHTYLTPTQNVFDGNIVDSGLSVTFANKNAFDWTPTLTASTPGDLSVAYSTRVGKASITGNTLTASFEVTTTTWTHTTASGVMRISGLPFAVASGISNIGPLAGEGWTLAGVSCLGTRADVGSTNIRFLATRSGAALTSITPSQCPSGTQQTWVGTVSYFI